MAIEFPFDNRLFAVGSVNREVNNVHPTIFANRPDNSQLLIDNTQKDLMRKFATEIKDSQGIKASWQVGYSTLIKTPDWTISVVDQKGIGRRRIVTSHINPEMLNNGAVENLYELEEFYHFAIGKIKKALSLPTFSNDDRFKATRRLLKYQKQILPVTPRSSSPAQLCILEFNSRMKPQGPSKII